MELIHVTTDAHGAQVVSARDLHEFLQSKQQFADWIKARIEKYGFIENQDYTEVFHKVMKNSKGGRTSTDYALTLSTAKELAMVESNEKGRQARQYFIECEKKLKQLHIAPNPNNVELIKAFLDNILSNYVTKEELKETVQAQCEKVKADCTAQMLNCFYIFLEDLNTHEFEPLEDGIARLETAVHAIQTAIKNTLGINFYDKTTMPLTYVYLIQEGSSNVYKIGLSNYVDDREQELNVGNSEVLIAIHEIAFRTPKIAKLFENQMHEIFERKHKKGEWFILNEQDINLIKQIGEMYEALQGL